jgi:hypothetical protein
VSAAGCLLRPTTMATQPRACRASRRGMPCADSYPAVSTAMRQTGIEGVSEFSPEILVPGL